ncbi:facilitated glucose transporter [Trichuris trichiura]|uniref:Facilitated glucose transporter n=1 Tax=Trichuris trichiura TaxID=36087 RepID=A0A077YYF1_TRITR|nr:facilitated glucose transporter [Trichuris trichiura]
MLIMVSAMGLGAHFQFYSNSVVNNVVDDIKPWFNQSYIEHYGSSLTPDGLTLLWSMASAFGAIITRPMAEKLGRRGGLITTGITCAAGSLLTVIAKYVDAFELFFIGRLLLGVSLGASLGLASMFVTETAPVRYRGACGSLLQIMLGLGNLLSLILTLPQLFGTAQLWPAAMAIPLITSLLQVLITFQGEESPRFLLMAKKDEGAALRSLVEPQMVQIRGELNPVQPTPVKENGNKEEVVKEEEKKAKTSLSALFKYPYLRPMLLAIVVAFSIQFSGIAAVLAYSKTMFESAGLSTNTAKYGSVGLGVCNTLAPFLSTALVEKAGRKIILLGGLLLSTVSLAVMIGCSEAGNTYGITDALIGTIVCMYGFQIGFALSSSILWIVVAELFPQSLRSLAVTITSFSFFVFQSIVVLCYLPFASKVGFSISFLPFILSGIICVAILGVFLPETKGKSIQEISAYFSGQKEKQKKQPTKQSLSTIDENTRF